MGWDIRRFADEARKSSVYDAEDTSLLWLTRDAISRLESARQHSVLEYQPLPFDRTLMVGFASPLNLPNGDAAWLSVRAPSAYIRELQERVNRDWDTLNAEHRATVTGALQEMRESFGRGDRTVAALQVSGSLVGYVIVNAGTMEEVPIDMEPGDELTPTISNNILRGEDAVLLLSALRSAWTVYSSAVESDAAAVDVTPAPVQLGNKRKARNIELQVVDVRKEAGGSGSRSAGGEPLEHDFRWRVSGHPRWQWYGSGEGRHQRRIWVAGHVRGPANKPIKPRVEVVRGEDV